MGRIPLITSILLAAGCCALVQAQPTSQTWELKGREWRAISPDAAAANEPELDRIEGLLSRGSAAEAFRATVRWLKQNPDSKSRDRALTLAARSLNARKERVKAFYYCDELLDTYPESPYYQSALEFQYQIADTCLSTPPPKFLGLPFNDLTDDGIEMLFRIQQRAPGSQLAERALLRTADFYYADAQYDLAGDAYAAYARSYPRSPELSRVKLRQAWSYLAQFRNEKFDATPLVNARAQLTDLAATDPELAQSENVGALLDRIDSSMAQKLIGTADYYRRTKKPEASAYLYGLVLKTYPSTPEAAKAQQELDRLPGSAREAADAPPPTTQVSRAR